MLFSLELLLPRDAASVPVARRLLASSLEALGVTEPILIDVELMLTEACTNVIRHATASDAYAVQLVITNDRCVIKVLDHGSGFDAASRGNEPDFVHEHGRGLMIMKSLSDDIRFQALRREGALVAMEKELEFRADALAPMLAEAEAVVLDRVAVMDEPADGPADEPAPDSEPDPELEEFATRLFDLARTGQTERLAAYVDAGVPVNLANDRGDTLLMLAAYHGQAGTVTALAARGADPERANDRGQSPLAGAVFKKEPAVVRALLDAGADPHAGEPSAVDTARMFGHTEFLAWFGAG